MNPIYLETKRLLLRSLHLDDAEPLAEIWSNAEVTRYLGGPRDYAQLVADFKNDVQTGLTEKFDLWPTVERATGQVVGHCGLLEKDIVGQPEIELIYVFSPTVWRRGYATEIGLALRDYAFKELHVSSLVALIDPNHQGSAHVVEKLGFSLEQQVLRPDGKVRRLYRL